MCHLIRCYLVVVWTCLVVSSNLYGQTSFSEVAASVGVDHYYHTIFDMGGGVALFDFNRDSLVDIYFVGGQRRDVLYQNNGNGTFTDVTLQAGLGFTDSVGTMGVVTGDIDNDGYREVFLTTVMNEPNYLLQNNGNGTFTDISTAAGINNDTLFTLSATFGDYDKDGWLDLYVGNYVDVPNTVVDSAGNFVSFNHICSPNTLFHNNGNMTFTDVSATTNTADAGCDLATVFTDYDSDNDVDVWVANDFGAWLTPNGLYQNNHPSAFSNVAASSNADAQIYAMGVAIGDYDQDLDLDYYITNIGRNVLHRNNGNGTFIDTADAAGVSNQWVIQDSLQATGWGTGFMDIDNDSYLDLFVANGYMAGVDVLKTTEQDPDKLYHNNGDGTFSDISAVAGVNSDEVTRGFAFGDLDNDGDIDLIPIPTLIQSSVDTSKMPIYRNDLNNTNHWLKVNLEGTISNRDAYGAQLRIYTNGQAWVHEVSCGGTHASQHSSVAHFGLGSATSVDSLVITWPNGLVERLTNVTVDQTLYLVEGMVTATITPTTHKNIRNCSIFPNPAQKVVNLRFSLEKEAAVSLAIYNVYGQQVDNKQYDLSVGEQQIRWNRKQLPAAMYWVELRVGNEKVLQKIVLK